MPTKIIDQSMRIYLEDLEKMYVLLVWLGLRKPKDYLDIEMIKKIAFIVNRSPNYASRLELPEVNKYYLGFYSGCLASIRYVLATHYEGIETANANFPDLEVYA